MWEVPLDRVQIKSREVQACLVQCKPQIPNPWASKGEKMRSRGLAWPHLSKGRVPGALSNGCSFQMCGLIFLAEECFGFFSCWEEGTFNSQYSREIPWWSEGGKGDFSWSALGSLRSCWNLGTENNLGAAQIMDEAAAEPQGAGGALSWCTLQEFLSRTQGSFSPSVMSLCIFPFLGKHPFQEKKPLEFSVWSVF